MIKTCGLVVCFAAAAVLVGRTTTASADVASAKRAPDRKGERQVKDRLVRVGMDSRAADRQVAGLTAQEVSFFAADADRVQVVGAMTWYEFLAGLGFGMLIAGFFGLLALHANL